MSDGPISHRGPARNVGEMRTYGRDGTGNRKKRTTTNYWRNARIHRARQKNRKAGA